MVRTLKTLTALLAFGAALAAFWRELPASRVEPAPAAYPSQQKSAVCTAPVVHPPARPCR